jgi:hypothetical protein
VEDNGDLEIEDEEEEEEDNTHEYDISDMSNERQREPISKV